MSQLPIFEDGPMRLEMPLCVFDVAGTVDGTFPQGPRYHAMNCMTGKFDSNGFWCWDHGFKCFNWIGSNVGRFIR